MTHFMQRLVKACIILLWMVVLSCHEKKLGDSSWNYYQLKDQVIEVSSIEDGLDVPWEVKFHDGALWYSLQKGEIWRMNLITGTSRKVLTVPGVFRLRTMGALGMTVDKVSDSIKVYIVYNHRIDTSKLDTSSLVTRLVGYSYDPKQDSLVNPRIVLQWKASTSHNGSRVIVGKKGDLFVTTGDLEDNRMAQDIHTLNGKVLRVMKDGSVPIDNPFKNSYVWSYGHRNQQGICFGDSGLLYASEHGDAIEDEVNLIEPRNNYGWPLVEGKLDEASEIHKVDSLHLSITEPLLSWTPTIAPASMAYYGKGPIKEFQNSLLLVTLKGSALYVLHLDATGKKIISQDVYFKKIYGRLRSICVDDEGQVYVGTSNRDWNPAPGYPKLGDDHILKIKVVSASQVNGAEIKDPSVKEISVTNEQGKQVFMNYCSSCHKANGEGLSGNFPPLKNNPILLNTEKLVSIISQGRTGKQIILRNTYTQAMPGFSFLKDDQMLDLINYMKTHLADDRQLSLKDLKVLRNNLQKPYIIKSANH